MQKKLYPLFTGLGNALIIIVIVNLVLSLTGGYIDQIFFFVLLPVGAVILGALSTKGIVNGYRKYDEVSMGTLYVYSIIVSLFCFIGIYVVSYFTAFISSDMSLNHRFIGQHISHFVMKGTNEKINFINFMKYEMRPKNVSLLMGPAYPGSQQEYSTVYDSTVNWLRFCIEGVAFIVMGIIRTKEVNSILRCVHCNKILVRKNLEMYDINKEIDLNQIHEQVIAGDSQNPLKIKNKIPKYGNKKFKVLNILFCPECIKGYLQLRFYYPEYYMCKELSLKREEIDIDNEFISKLI